MRQRLTQRHTNHMEPEMWTEIKKHRDNMWDRNLKTPMVGPKLKNPPMVGPKLKNPPMVGPKLKNDTDGGTEIKKRHRWWDRN